MGTSLMAVLWQKRKLYKTELVFGFPGGVLPKSCTSRDVLRNISVMPHYNVISGLDTRLNV